MRLTLTRRPLARLAATGILAFCGSTQAQVAYDAIEIGSRLDAKGISLGLFAKPIPLPEGEWTVVGKHEEQLALSGGNSESPRVAPRIGLTLRSASRQNSPVVALVVRFTPNAIPINWGNRPCTTNNPLGLLDDYGLNANAMLYACARADSAYNFKATIRDVKNSTNAWTKTYLAGLEPFADDIPANVVLVDIYGNKFRGKWMGMTFILRADANADVNPTYREHLKTWMHSAGEKWMKVLNNDATDMPGPETFGTRG